MITKPLVVSVADFCALASIKKTKAFQLIRDGVVESTLCGRKRLIRMSSIERLLGIDSGEVR